MVGLYPDIEPYDHGMLDVDDGNLIYWEVCGNPDGKPAIALHGGPGSGCTPWWRRLFDPKKYKIVLFDQRGCGRSRPYAGDYSTSLADNNTQNLVSDVEWIRLHLGIERLLVIGGSWGSTLALAYAEAHPHRVSEMVLFGVTTGRHCEFDWLFRGGVSIFFPEQWERLRSAAPVADRDGDLVMVYNKLLNDADPEVRRKATEAWCMWESATPDWPPATKMAHRFNDPTFAYAFARLVTYYVHHNAWLEDGVLLRGATKLADTPGTLINGRFDFQAPIGNTWELSRVWPLAELVIVDDAGHTAGTGVSEEIIKATDSYATHCEKPKIINRHETP
jgi:proline iminopeptidase